MLAHEQAHATLRQALRLAQAQGYMRVFLDEGELMRQRLAEAFMRARDPLPPWLHSYVRELLAAFPVINAAVTPAPARLVAEGLPSKAVLVEPLTERELDILALIAVGASNQDIANRLFLTVGTVKNHISNILGKLGAQNRTEAVVIANNLGLVNM